MMRCGRFLLVLFIILMTYLISSLTQQNSDDFRAKLGKLDIGALHIKEDAAYSQNGVQEYNMVKPRNDPNVKLTEVKPKAPNNGGPIPIILLTYMRSGSTFVGDLLQANAGVYYLFEPLHRLQFTMRDMKPIRYLNGTQRFYDNFLVPASTMIGNMATCNIQGVPVPVFEDGFFPYSKKAKLFRACVGTREITNLNKARSCLPKLVEECASSSHLVFKIIRAPMHILEPLMERIPKMKIIHLLRDPRATLSSQNKAGVVKKLYLAENATKYCNRVYGDVIKAEELTRKFPGRIMTVQYEDITHHPIKLTRQLYTFANLPFTNEVMTKITSLTSPKIVNNRNRGNSSTRAYAWRKSIEMNFVNTVDNSCGQLYAKQGLNKIPTETQLRDLTYSIRPVPPKLDDYRYA